jgi:hypothetical protein
LKNNGFCRKEIVEFENGDFLQWGGWEKIMVALFLVCDGWNWLKI